MQQSSPDRPNITRRPLSKYALFVAAAALAFALLALLSSFGAKWGWWHFSTGFSMLRVSAYWGIASAAAALIALYLTRPGGDRRGLPFALVGLLVGLTTFVVLWQIQRLGQRVPPIHDITTDTENPPQFVDVVPLRADAPNSIDYGGPEVAAQQREAYPEVRPLEVDVSPERLFPRAVEAARAMGWKIVAADSTEKRIEATAETFWYGFKDDVVVRIEAENGGSRLDVRSVSRVGRGDMGVNARRVKRYLERVERSLPE